MRISSDKALAALELAAQQVLERAQDTRSGVGMSCFATERDQITAFEKAEEKEAMAKLIVAVVASFKSQYGDFK